MVQNRGGDLQRLLGLMVMRYLIDGYNLMHALGLMRPRFGPGGLQRARHRFLNDLAHALGPADSVGTTIVFDAASLPEDADRQAHHKGLTILFAVDDEDADTRIEHLIAHQSAPKTLTVVSSDHRLRRAAHRRGARSMTADDFACLLEGRKARKSRLPPASPAGPTDPEERLRHQGPSPTEARDWLAIFGDLDSELASDASPGGPASLGLTDADIRQIEREVEEEIRRDANRRNDR